MADKPPKIRLTLRILAVLALGGVHSPSKASVMAARRAEPKLDVALQATELYLCLSYPWEGRPSR